MKKTYVILIFFLLGVLNIRAQVTIGTLEDPQKFSILELITTDSIVGGLRLPQLTTDDRIALTESEAFQEEKNGKAVGLVIYNTTLGCMECWDGTEWVAYSKAKIQDLSEKVEDLLDDTRNLKTISNDYSNVKSFSLPFPRKLVRVDLTGVVWDNLETKADEIEATMIYTDYDGSYFEKPILLSYQGSSSINYEKKNFVFDLLNKDGSSCDIKIGNWAVMDSYNLKANYIDFTQIRNVVTSRLAFEAANARSFGKRFPWEATYNEDVTAVNYRFDDGARGVIDGFPMELYINGEYWGLYTFNIKKTRKNFLMKKKEETKIIMGAETQNDWTRYIPSQWDIKNPDPVTEATMEKVDRIFTWMKGVGDGSIDFESTYQDYWIKDEWIDYLIFMTVFYAPDCIHKNGIFCTWDGDRWAFKLYDLDTTWGLDWMGSRIIPQSLTDIFPDPDSNIANSMPWKVILHSSSWMNDVKKRYTELRKTILSESYVQEKVSSLADIFGTQNYEKDAKRWPKIPSNGSPDIWNRYPGCYTGTYQMLDWYQKRVALVDSQWMNEY